MNTIHLNKAFPESCGEAADFVGGPKTTTCPMCLANLRIADTGGYHFPATKFVEENDSYAQAEHVYSEFDEWGDEVVDRDAELMEAWDLLHSVETWLRIREKEGADVQGAKAAVLKKNADRGYYQP